MIGRMKCRWLSWAPLVVLVAGTGAAAATSVSSSQSASSTPAPAASTTSPVLRHAINAMLAEPSFTLVEQTVPEDGFFGSNGANTVHFVYQRPNRLETTGPNGLEQ